jgi:hypothetical protein
MRQLRLCTIGTLRTTLTIAVTPVASDTSLRYHVSSQTSIIVLTIADAWPILAVGGRQTEPMQLNDQSPIMDEGGWGGTSTLGVYTMTSSSHHDQ